MTGLAQARPAARRRRIGQSWGLGRFLALIAFTVGFASLGIWQVRRQYEVIAQGYEIDRDLFEYRRLLERQKRLSLLLSAYKDPTALRLFAEEDLGMSPPTREEELFIPDPSAARPIAGAREPERANDREQLAPPPALDDRSEGPPAPPAPPAPAEVPPAKPEVTP